MSSTRVTQGMINTQLVRNLSGNLGRMNRLQDQLSTGRRINKPSDDPVGLSFSMRYRSELSANDQYQQNIDSTISWLEYTDSTLSKTGDVLQRARELAVQGSNGTNSQSSLDAIKSEVNQLISELVNIGNSDFNGKHVFNGQKTDIAPYSSSTPEANTTDNTDIQFEIGPNVKIPVNVTGNEVFGDPNESDNAFKVLKDFAGALESGNFAGVNDALGRLDTRINTFLGVRSEIGAKMNRVQLSEDRIKDIGTNLHTLQSKIEDADVAEAITNLKTAENVYQASLSVGSKIISPSLVDFLH